MTFYYCILCSSPFFLCVREVNYTSRGAPHNPSGVDLCDLALKKKKKEKKRSRREQACTNRLLLLNTEERGRARAAYNHYHEEEDTGREGVHLKI